MNSLVRLINTIVMHGLEAFGRYYSCYRAFVFDTNDPENLQRIKLIIPQISGDQAYNYWSMPKGVFYGEGYGSQILPQKGDVVWVEFEGGAPEIPIWSHGHPGRKELPTKDPDLKEKDCYWLLTPKGNFVKLYDTKNILHIENTLGYYLETNGYGHSLVTDKKISLGSFQGSKESAMLADTAMNLLNEFITDLGNIGMIETSTGLTNTIKTSPMWTTLVNKWNTKWAEFKSQKVNLD